MRGDPAADVNADGAKLFIRKRRRCIVVVVGRTHTPVQPGMRNASTPNAAVARIMASSSMRTYQTTSRRISPSCKIG